MPPTFRMNARTASALETELATTPALPGTLLAPLSAGFCLAIGIAHRRLISCTTLEGVFLGHVPVPITVVTKALLCFHNWRCPSIRDGVKVPSDRVPIREIPVSVRELACCVMPSRSSHPRIVVYSICTGTLPFRICSFIRFVCAPRTLQCRKRRAFNHFGQPSELICIGAIAKHAIQVQLRDATDDCLQ